MKKYQRLVVLFLVLGVFKSFADSPVTSADFWQAYPDFPTVQYAHDTGFLDLEVGAFLVDDNIPLEARAAAINAMGFGGENTIRFGFYIFLTSDGAYEDFEKTFLGLFSNDLLFLFAYMNLMDNFSWPEESYDILKYTFDQDPTRLKSIILSICIAQMKMRPYNATHDENGDITVGPDLESWKNLWEVFYTGAYEGEMREDIRPEAVKLMEKYMILYKKY